MGEARLARKLAAHASFGVHGAQATVAHRDGRVEGVVGVGGTHVGIPDGAGVPGQFTHHSIRPHGRSS